MELLDKYGDSAEAEKQIEKEMGLREARVSTTTHSRWRCSSEHSDIYSKARPRWKRPQPESCCLMPSSLTCAMKCSRSVRRQFT